MKTSQQWWSETKADPAKLNEWLRRQYRGEMRAAKKLKELAEDCEKKLRWKDDGRAEFNQRHVQTLWMIAQDEAQHAVWIYGLLQKRGITAREDSANSENRYWSAVQVDHYTGFLRTMAAGAHAEKMRLDRIEAIAFDDDAPEDVRLTFTKILSDELFHERAFRQMAGPMAMEAQLQSHLDGMRLLGLEA